MKRYARDAVVITTQNEAGSISELVEVLRDRALDVIVIDNRSTDLTVQRARAAGAQVSVNSRKLGIGPSLQSGLRAAVALKYDRIVTFDAGGSHNPYEVPGLLAAHSTRRVDILIGSRFVAGGRYFAPTRRYWRAAASRIAATACNLKAGQPRRWHVRDWTSGLRAYSRDAADLLLSMPYRAQMHGWQIEVLDWALQLNLNVQEYPITYTAGRSSFSAAIAREALGAWWRVGRWIE